MLRSGAQTPVKITFNNVRTKAELAGKISKQTEADSLTVLNLLNDDTFLSGFGLTPITAISIFIPNTYEVYWNTPAKSLIKRMHNEYKKFWTKKRKQKAKKINLSPFEVSILASIVQAEQAKHNDEKPTIAGLYLNRIRKGMPLESCPTLIYAMGDFSISRVLTKDKEIDSPYNTYKYKGIPPGPIFMPDVSAIDAVLNAQKHKYLYFVANVKKFGYHKFAKTLSQHNSNRQEYVRWINSVGIDR